MFKNALSRLLVLGFMLSYCPKGVLADPVNLIQQIDALPWVHGPATVPIGDQSQIVIPKGYRYLGSESTGKFLELNGNPAKPGSYTISPETLSWFAVFSFDNSGYVFDTDKVDPDSLFKQLKRSEDAGNELRRSKGMAALILDKWLVAPHYDVQSHNLEWGTVMHDDHGSQVINYTTRILGRNGVTKSILVSDPENIGRDLTDYRGVARGFSYLSDKSYSAHKSGDKIAAYGLGALVAGGAAAAVVKTGLFAGILAFFGKIGLAFFKFIVVGVLAVAAAIGSWVKRLFGKRSSQ